MSSFGSVSGGLTGRILVRQLLVKETEPLRKTVRHTYVLWGLFIDIMIFIQYNLYILSSNPKPKLITENSFLLKDQFCLQEHPAKTHCDSVKVSWPLFACMGKKIILYWVFRTLLDFIIIITIIIIKKTCIFN